MNLKYCELNRFYSIDCRICDIFIFFIYFYIYRKKKKIFFGRGVLGVWWVIYGFFGCFFFVMLGIEVGWVCYCLKKKILFVY